MPRSSSPAVAVVNALLVPLGLAVLVAGVLGALSFPEIWWAFALLGVGGGGLMIYAAVRGIQSWSRSVEVDDATRHTMLAAAQAGAIPSDAVLAHWTYDPADWHRYAAAEIHSGVREALVFGATMAAFSVLPLRLLEPEWSGAVKFAAALGAFVAAERLLVALVTWRRHRSVGRGEVIVGPTAMLRNGRYEAIEDGRIHFRGARVLKQLSPATLEIGILVPGKYRHVREEYRIPIPPGKEDEAQAVADALERVHRPALAGSTPQRRADG